MSDSIGREVEDFMAQIGKPLLPWQTEVVRSSFATRADGRWAAYEVTLLAPRQNGKGAVTEAQEFGGLFLLKEKKIIHSAHLFDTSREAFERLVELIEGSDWLSSRVNKINQAHGKEGIELTRSAGGGKLKFKARTLHGTRGFSGDRIILDEAYGLTVGQHQAMSPILATLPNSQITYTSSPPDEQTGPMPDDAILPSIRKRGIDADPQMAFYEWSPPKKFNADDLEVWYQTNPSLGYLIDEEFLHRQRRIFLASPKPHAFATEHLGDWPDAATEQWLVIGEDQWGTALDPTSAPRDPVVFSVDVTPERTHAAIAVVGGRADRHVHGELVDHRPGTEWVVPRFVELCGTHKPAAVVIDPGGAAGSLLPDLTVALAKLYREPTPMTARDVAQGYGMFHDVMAPTAERRLRVRGADLMLADLTSAVAGATTRRIGDGTTWDRRTPTVDISPLVALTNALYGYLIQPPPPPPPATPTRAAVGDQRGIFRPTTRLKL